MQYNSVGFQQNIGRQVKGMIKHSLRSQINYQKPYSEMAQMLE